VIHFRRARAHTHTHTHTHTWFKPHPIRKAPLSLTIFS